MLLVILQRSLLNVGVIAVLLSRITRVNSFAPAFHDDLKENTFGVCKKGVYMPASDFLFDLVLEVICESPSSSGYLIRLTPRNSNLTR